MTYPTLDYASWRALHAGCIGGGLAAAVAGEGRSPLEAYARLTGALPEEDLSDVEHVQWGLLLEGPVIQEAARRSKLTVLHPDDAAAYLDNAHTEVLGLHGTQVFARLRKHPQLVCTYDAICADADGRLGYLEAKTTQLSRDAEWSDEDGCPAAYKVQVTHGLLVAPALEFGVVACLIRGNRLKLADCPRDEELCASLLALELDMLRRVRERKEPRVRCGDDGEQRAFKALHPSDNGKYIDLPGEALDLHAQLERAKADRLDAEKREEAAKLRLKQMIGDNSFGVLLGGQGTYSLLTKPRRAYPVKESTSRKLHYLKGDPK